MAKINEGTIEKAANHVGGMQKLASLVGVSYKTILDWKSGRSGITITNAVKIEEVTKGEVTAKEILPEFPYYLGNK